MKKLIISALALAALLIGPASSHAQIYARPVACINLSGNVYLGLRHNNVVLLQDFLASQGYFNNALPRGYFGQLTAQAVRRFQIAQGIPSTGYVGTLTRARIVVLSCPNTNGPTIDQVSGPTNLGINQSGTWTIQAHATTPTTLVYSVVWGDEALPTLTANFDSSLSSRFSQTATFSHIYSQNGVYHPTFYVQDSGGHQTSSSLSVTVGPIADTNTVTMVVPNGGESWALGSTQNLTWSYHFIEPVGPAPTFDVKIQGAPTIYCFTTPCPQPQPSTPQLIASNVSSRSYSWIVGQLASGASVGEGQYRIGVCYTGSTICDWSNGAFAINTTVSSNNPPVINSVSGPTSLNVGQSGTWVVSAYDPEAAGALNYTFTMCNVSSGNQQCYLPSSQTSYVYSFQPTFGGQYRLTVTATDTSGRSTNSSLTVVVI